MDLKLDFSDVLITPTHSTVKSRKDVHLETEYSFLYSNFKLKGVPIMAANMDTVGSIGTMQTLVEHNLFTCLHKFIPIKDFYTHSAFLNQNLDLFAVSIGFDKSEIDRLNHIHIKVPFKVICIDVANGYVDSFVEFCSYVRAMFPEKIIIAGNVCTKTGVSELVTRGLVDIVKCGIGSGSACTTRLKTGIGCPQLSCVQDCAAMAHSLGARIISDGGITCPGDVAKAFGAGADFVMIGGQFAGHSETPGNIIVDEHTGKQFKVFYGMSSSHAMKQNYTQNSNASYRTSEGRRLKIPFKGSLSNTVCDFLGGLRSTCTYTDNDHLSSFIGTASFVRVNNQFNSSLLNI